jgi:hypothetical protein
MTFYLMGGPCFMYVFTAVFLLSVLLYVTGGMIIADADVY